MNGNLSFTIKERETTGTGNSKSLRNTGFIPAVVYGNKQDPKSIYLEKKFFIKHLGDSALFNEIYTLELNGKSEEVLVREVQFDPIRSNDPIHINFLRVGKDSVVTIEVPIIFNNQDKSQGLKFGGILNIIAHTLEVRCNPKEAPKSIEIDLAKTKIGTVIKIEDIPLAKGVKVFYPKGYAIASITALENDDKKEAGPEEAAKA